MDLIELNPFLYHESDYLKSILARPSEIDLSTYQWPMRNAILSSLALKGAANTSKGPLSFASGISFESARCSHCLKTWEYLQSENRELELNRFLQSTASGTGVIDTRDWIHFKLAADSCAFKRWRKLDTLEREVTLFELIVLEGSPALCSGMMQLLYHFYWEKRILSHLLLPPAASDSLLLVAASKTEKDLSQVVAQLLYPLFFLKRLGVVEGEAQLLQTVFQSLSLAVADSERVPKGLQTLTLALMGSQLYKKQIGQIISAAGFPQETWQWLAKNEVAFVDVDNGRWVVWVGIGVAVAFLVSAVISVLMWRWVEGKRGALEALSAKAAEPLCEDQCSLLDE